MAKPSLSDRQTDIVGTSADVAGLLRMKSAAPITPRKPQKPCDIGLFSDEADQIDLCEMFQDEPVENYVSPWEQRETPTGFLQFREGASGRWRFQVYGFRDKTCTVHAVGGWREVRIDSGNRILIEGKWHGPQHWNH